MLRTYIITSYCLLINVRRKCIQSDNRAVSVRNDVNVCRRNEAIIRHNGLYGIDGTVPATVLSRPQKPWSRMNGRFAPKTRLQSEFINKRSTRFGGRNEKTKTRFRRDLRYTSTRYYHFGVYY